MPPSGSRRRPADTGRRSPAERAPTPSRPLEPRAGTTTLVLGCGALGRELVELVERNGLTHMDVRCLPAVWHNRPELIAPAIDEKLTEAEGKYEQMFVAYADCGTGGALDEVLSRHGVERALLRVLRGPRRVQPDRGRGAGIVLPDGLPGAQL
jgi:Protein of unknown function (DUF1638)